MRIGPPEVRQENGRAVYQTQVRYGDDSLETLWFSVDLSHADMMSHRADAALTALLIPAMHRGEDVVVEGPITDELLFNLRRSYQSILRTVIPSLQPARIEADDPRPTVAPANGVATGFSAGVDSFTVIADHYMADVPSALRLTHLLFNNVGSHGGGGERVFRDRYARAAPVAADLGLPFIAVNSNLADFYRGHGLPFQRTHTPRNAAVAMLLQRGLGRFLYASAYPYPDVKVTETDAIAYSDAVALPLLSTRAVEMRSSGGEYSRVDKTLRITEVPESYGALDVCVLPDVGGNCSTCWKCMRTLLTLEIAGELDRYAGVFSLNKYRRRRTRYMAEVLNSRDPLQREIVALAAERGFDFGTRARILAPAMPSAVRVERRARRTARRLRDRLR